MFYVYFLQSTITDRNYVGLTSDLKRRMREHNAGQNLSTKAYKPWELVFYEAYNNREDAVRREKYLKTTQGRQALRRMLRHHFEKTSRISFDYQGSTTG